MNWKRRTSSPLCILLSLKYRKIRPKLATKASTPRRTSSVSVQAPRSRLSREFRLSRSKESPPSARPKPLYGLARGAASQSARVSATMASAGPRSQSLDLFSTPGPTDGDPMNSAMLGNGTREASLHLTSDTMTPCNRTRALPGAQSTSSHVGNAPEDASLPESNRMDTDRTLSDEETAVNDEEGWTPYTRRKPQRKIEPSQLRTERISRPHYILSIRPLNKTHVHNIPKQAITTALELTARNWQISNLALYRYDPVANCVKVTVRDEQHADKLSKLTTTQTAHQRRQPT